VWECNNNRLLGSCSRKTGLDNFTYTDTGISVVKVCHHRPDAYSAEQVLLNKRQIYGGAPKLHWYPDTYCEIHKIHNNSHINRRCLYSHICWASSTVKLLAVFDIHIHNKRFILVKRRTHICMEFWQLCKPQSIQNLLAQWVSTAESGFELLKDNWVQLHWNWKRNVTVCHISFYHIHWLFIVWVWVSLSFYSALDLCTEKTLLFYGWFLDWFLWGVVGIFSRGNRLSNSLSICESNCQVFPQWPQFSLKFFTYVAKLAWKFAMFIMKIEFNVHSSVCEFILGWIYQTFTPKCLHPTDWSNA